MRKSFCLLFTALICCFIATGTASATVTGEGTFDLFGLPDNTSIDDYGYGTSYTDPETGETVPVSNYFGRIREFDHNNGTTVGSIAYGLDPDNDYKGSGSYHSSTVTGQFHQETGSEEFTLSAVAPDPGSVDAEANINFIGRASFTGSIYDYDFGYNYAFSGSKDNEEDYLSFLIQSEISYWDQDIHERVYIYSDYGTSGLITNPEENYRTNWLSLQDNDGQSVEGATIFDYSAADFYEGFDPYRTWFFEWDFMGYGRDTEGATPTSAPVPEPTTFILLGSGLAGLFFYRRKKR